LGYAEPGDQVEVVAGRLVVDARGVLDADRWMAEGFEVHTVGVGHRSGD